MMIESLVKMRNDPDGLPVDQFWILVERFRADLVNQALALLGNQSDAEDVAQETLCKAFIDLHELRDPQKLGNWLRSINKRIALNYRRRKFRLKEERLATGKLNSLEDEGGDDTKPDSPAGHMLAAVDRLPVQFREVLVLRYWEKLSTEDIALRLEIPSGTVRSRLTRADGMLAKALHALIKIEDHPQ